MIVAPAATESVSVIFQAMTGLIVMYWMLPFAREGAERRIVRILDGETEGRIDAEAQGDRILLRLPGEKKLRHGLKLGVRAGEIAVLARDVEIDACLERDRVGAEQRARAFELR